MTVTSDRPETDSPATDDDDAASPAIRASPPPTELDEYRQYWLDLGLPETD